jgi:TonB family protein
MTHPGQPPLPPRRRNKPQPHMKTAQGFAFLVGLVVGGSGAAAADAPAGAAPKEEAFDVRAERARRDAVKRAKQVQDIERMKKAGEAFQIKYVAPKFPSDAPKDVSLVMVTAAIHIDEAGVVRGIRIESPSNPLFDWAVVEAVWQWRYSPQKSGGAAVPFDWHETVAVVREPEMAANPTPPSVGQPAGR